MANKETTVSCLVVILNLNSLIRMETIKEILTKLTDRTPIEINNPLITIIKEVKDSSQIIRTKAEAK